MNDPRDFLPKKYRIYLENTNSLFVHALKKETKDAYLAKRENYKKLGGFFVILILIIGIVSSYILTTRNQDNRQQASTDQPYEELSSQITSSCDSGWFVCNTGCCGAGGTVNDGKRYSLLVDAKQCPGGKGNGCVNGHFTWYHDDDLSNNQVVQSAVTAELIARGLIIKKNGEIVRTPSTTPTPVVKLSISVTPSSTLTPTPTPKIPTSEIANRPETEGACSGQGSWFGSTCYLYWEVLPGGTHVVAPPNTIDNRSYTTFQPVSAAENYLSTTLEPSKKPEEVISNTQVQDVVPTISTESKTNVYFNQLDSRWKNIAIGENTKFGNVGCGVTSVANLTGISPDKVLDLYEIGKSITANGTGIEANAAALEKLGYQTSIGVNNNGVLEDEVRRANSTNNYSEVVKDLENYQKDGGWQIMLNGNFGNLDGGGHWVVVKEIDVDNNKVTVIDSNGGKLKEYTFSNTATSGDDDVITPKRLLLAKAN